MKGVRRNASRLAFCILNVRVIPNRRRIMGPINRNWISKQTKTNSFFGQFVISLKINTQREVIALSRRGTQKQRPKLPMVTPPGMPVNTVYKCLKESQPRCHEFCHCAFTVVSELIVPSRQGTQKQTQIAYSNPTWHASEHCVQMFERVTNTLPWVLPLWPCMWRHKRGWHEWQTCILCHEPTFSALHWERASYHD